MDFFSIDAIDQDTAQALLNIYPETTADLFEKDYARRYGNEEDAHAAQISDYLDSVAAFLSQDDRYMFALREGDVIIAALRVIHMGADHWYLEALGTAPEYRGRGCARRLLTETLRCMRVLQARSIVSVVKQDNTASRAAHEACGFKDTGKSAKDMQGAEIEDCLVYQYDYPNRNLKIY